MIDVNYLRQNPQNVQKGAESKGANINVDHILEVDKKYRELLTNVQGLREERNKFAREKNVEKGKEIKDRLEKEEHAMNAVKEELDGLLMQIPNLPKPDVKVGKDESENEIIRKYKEPTKFDFTPCDHLKIGEKLDIIDVERASKISGSRFYFLKNQGVLLEFALKQLAFDTLLKEGFIPILPPVLIKEEIMRKLGYMENGGDEDMYIFEKDKLALVGTSEQSIVPIYKDEILNEKELPKRYIGFSTCFRREAGSYGKDTRGILRAHQFDKVEMVSFVKEGEDDDEHEYLLSLEEKFLQMLELPYQVVKMCTVDLGFPVARKYDVEGWIPSENKYRELTSTSTTTDFQARALNIKYLGLEEDTLLGSVRLGEAQLGGTAKREVKKYVNILNGTVFSTRPIVAILENCQQEDGTVIVPEVLRKYTVFEKISPKKQ